MTNEEILAGFQELIKPLTIRNRGYLELLHAINYLKEDQPEKAKEIYTWEWDQTNFHVPEIVKFLKQIGWIKKHWGEGCKIPPEAYAKVMEQLLKHKEIRYEL